MRIVVGATDHPLPPTDGMRLHLWHVLSDLRQRHEVILVSAPGPADDVDPATIATIADDFRPAPRTPPPSRLRSELDTFGRGRSKVVDSVRRSALVPTIRAVVAEVEPDVVHLQTGALAVLGGTLGVPTVVVPLDANDLNAAAASRYAGNRLERWFVDREARRWRAFERSAYAACDEVVVVGDRDAAMLRVTDPRLNPAVIPNGVDTVTFRPSDSPRSSDTVVLHGAMDYAPNVDAAVFAANEVLPLVRQVRPEARLVLAGRNPSAAVRALAGPAVEVTGALDDLRPVLQQAAVYLCPMRLGSGIKNKLLEAFACGCPTVATPLAVNGVAVTEGDDVLLADDAASLASAVARVLGDAPLAASLGAGARQLAESMSWAVTAAQFEAVYERARRRSTHGR
jgi:glycosyltransferase involved in cell wall biosynthesis